MTEPNLIQQFLAAMRGNRIDTRPLYRCPWCQWSGTEPSQDQDGTRRCPCCATIVHEETHA
jgi:hypothetical protein